MKMSGNGVIMRKREYLSVVNDVVTSFRKAQKLFLRYEPDELEKTDYGQDLLLFSGQEIDRSARILSTILTVEDRNSLFEAVIKNLREDDLKKFENDFASKLDDDEVFKWFLKLSVNYGVHFSLADARMGVRQLVWDADRD